MNEVAALAASPAGEDVLLPALEGVVRETFGARSTIAAIRPITAKARTSHACHLVTVGLGTGEEMTLFLKDYSSYKGSRPGMEERREREMCVYRDLLGGADLGTARYYGSLWDQPRGFFGVLLEFVPGTPVRYCEFPYWLSAAVWLGRMQGYFARHSTLLEKCDCLLRHDEHFFHSVAVKAERSVFERMPALARRLAPVLGEYDRVAKILACPLTTLVHGSYAAGQVLVNPGVEPQRPCPIDWEFAGVGPALYDLGVLVDGFKTPRLDELLDAYRDEATAQGVPVPDDDKMKLVMRCCRLHRVMHHLSRCAERNYPDTAVAGLIQMSDQLSRLVL